MLSIPEKYIIVVLILYCTVCNYTVAAEVVNCTKCKVVTKSIITVEIHPEIPNYGHNYNSILSVAKVLFIVTRSHCRHSS